MTDLAAHLKTWARANKVKFSENDTGSFFLSRAKWIIEVVPAGEWFYLHGRGELNGIGTTVMSADELDAAVARLWVKQSE